MLDSDRINIISYKVIGLIHTPFREPKGTPIQPTAGQGTEGSVELFPEYTEALKDIAGFSHVFLIYHMHLAKSSLIVKPFLDDAVHGALATRSPGRPNTIGLSIVRLICVEKNILRIRDLDIIDNTPLLDIKPFVPEFDMRTPTKVGWYINKVERFTIVKDDGRFIANQNENDDAYS
jgi:tRNA (adenine37-N6)-methyltransferase